MGKVSSIKNVRTSKLTGLTAFLTLLINKPAWGRYSASNWRETTLTDLTGNARHAITSGVSQATASGDGATASITYLTGTASNTITFPSGSCPSTFTICALTRFTTSTTGCVLQSTTSLVCGHYINIRGGVFNNTWITNTSTVGTLTNWLNTVVTNGSMATPNNVLIDGTVCGTLNNTYPGSGKLTINNNGAFGNPSAFAFSQLIIWDVALTATEMSVVATALNTYLSTGILK